MDGNRTRPTYVRRGDGFKLNAAAVIAILYVQPEEELTKQDIARALHRARERANAALAAECLKPAPRSKDAVLWETYHGDVVETAIRRGDDYVAAALAEGVAS